MAKKRTIKLIDFTNFCVEGGQRFKAPFTVDVITNSAQHSPGDRLTKLQVNDLCEISDFEVITRMPKDTDFGKG